MSSGRRGVVASIVVVLGLGLTSACGSDGRSRSVAVRVTSPPVPSTSSRPPAPPAPSMSSLPPAPPAPSTASRPAATSTSAPVAAPTCPLPATGFDCDFQQRITAADAYARSRPGTTGFVVRDRQTGAVFANGYANTPVWTASTIKLAMVIALEEWNADGEIQLSTDDRNDIAAMLHSSDDNAADRLWFKYAGADHLAYNNRFATYGMAHLVPQRGFTNFYPYWGFQKCTPTDLDALDHYLLTTLAPALRDYIVGALQNVDPDQQWGVWGAGPAATPGNKDGWSLEQGGQVMNSVGFVGPGQRYTLAMMNSLNGEGGYDTGRATVTQVAATLFAGRF